MRGCGLLTPHQQIRRPKDLRSLRLRSSQNYAVAVRFLYNDVFIYVGGAKDHR